MATIPIYHATIVPPVTGAMSTEYFENFLNTTMNSTSGELITIMNHGKLVLSWRELVEQDLLITVDASIDTSLTVFNLDSNASYSGVIDWGDGSADTILSGTGNTSISHTFTSTGVYQVRVSGSAVPRFRLSSQLNVVSVENLGNVGLQTTDSMFSNCTNLVSVNIGNYVTSIEGGTFDGCTSLTSSTIGNSVTSIGNYAFYNCTSLTSITIPDSVTSIGDIAFAYCTGLTSINIGNSVTSIGNYAFNSCTALASIIIADSVTSIGSSAFRNCTLLATIDLSQPKSVIDGATDIFLDTESPLTLNVPIGTSGWTADSGLSIGGNTNVTVNLV